MLNAVRNVCAWNKNKLYYTIILFNKLETFVINHRALATDCDLEGVPCNRINSTQWHVSLHCFVFIRYIALPCTTPPFIDEKDKGTHFCKCIINIFFSPSMAGITFSSLDSFSVFVYFTLFGYCFEAFQSSTCCILLLFAYHQESASMQKPARAYVSAYN